MFASAPAHANASHLEIRVQLNTDLEATVAGALSDESGKGINQAPIEAHLDGTKVGSATTKGNGQFTLEFTVPETLQSGNRRLVISYAGEGEHGPAESAAILALGEAPAADAAGEQPETDAAPSSQLQAKASSSSPRNGDLIELSGTLAAPGGEALTNASIEVLGPDGEVPDSFTMTNGEGGFQTFYEVPIDQEDPLTLTLRFPGSEGYPAAQADVPLDVEYVDLLSAASEAPDSGSEQTSNSSPHDEASAADGAGVEQPTEEPTIQAVSDPSAGDAAPETEAQSDEGAGALPWIIGGVGALAGVAIVAAVAVVLGRSGLGSRANERDGALNIFEDPDDEAVDAVVDATPRRGAN